MPPIYIPSAGPDDWRWLLAKPGLQWKQDASAKSLADTWEFAAPWPPKVEAALAEAGFVDLEMLLALPEHEVPLPGGRRASQTDLFVLARGSRGLLAIAVEGKAEEPFGVGTVAEWRHEGSAGKEKRLAYLLGLLGLADDERTGGLHYQLLHRTAAAAIEARRFGASDALMLVHSFSSTSAHFEAFAAFAKTIGAAPQRDGIASAASLGDVRLHLGWVTDTPPPGAAELPALGPRFDRAVASARGLHKAQMRKGTSIPYVAHLLAVASLVAEDGGTEDEVIAALLHDAVEDQGGQPTLRGIEMQFGSEAARIVLACSDTDVVPKPPWRERKEAYIAHVEHTDRSTLRVSLADKLHNARAILFDLRTIGDEVWARFSADPDEVLWNYAALAEAFASRDAGPMVPELQRTVRDIEALRRAPDPSG